MLRYSTSRFRIVLLGVMLAAAMFVLLMPGDTFARQAAAPSAADTATTGNGEGTGLIHLILGHVDFVFITIAVLSVWGLTLIIQGFLRNRMSVFLPEPTINMIREMIAQKRFKDLIDFTETDPSFIGRALNPALKRAPNFSHMKE